MVGVEDIWLRRGLLRSKIFLATSNHRKKGREQLIRFNYLPFVFYTEQSMARLTCILVVLGC